MTKDNFVMPDYYNQSKPKAEEDLVKRKCFRCGKEKEIGRFERYCSSECRYHATKNYFSSYKVGF
jgi:hypothetical protein